MTLFFTRLWAFLKSVPTSVYATFTALVTIAVLYLQRKSAEERERAATEAKKQAEIRRRAAEVKNKAVVHRTKAEIAIHNADKIADKRESIRKDGVKTLEQIEDLTDEEISQMMLRDAEEARERLKKK